jgi:hypothetical protein
VKNITEILALDTLDETPPSDALDAIAQLVDYAFDENRPELTSKALGWCDRLESHLSSERQRVELDYYRANAWAHRQSAKQSSHAAVWEWDQKELQQQVFLLRRALNSPAFEELHVVRKCQILTNLANQLDTVGRFVEARALWGKALARQSNFWMARGNRGRGLMHYAVALYDPGHRAVFALAAHRDLLDAVRDIDRHPELGDPSLRPYFAAEADSIEKHFDLAEIAKSYRANGFTLGDNEDERAFRTWCLQEVLFLNPLNDVEPSSIAACDVLALPSFVTRVSEPPVLVGFFNQIKQEFVSARWLLFEASHSNALHFSDRNVLLYDTFDYPALGLGVEKVKLAFRMGYSILDKIAYFLNRYMTLGIPEKRISFRHVWREKETGPVRPAFSASENWPFRGLYWLSKDLFEKDFKEMTEPDARALQELRNHLEHKYVKVHALAALARPSEGATPDIFFDSFAHSITRDDLERKTLRILKLARSALIYLSLGMHKEEVRRAGSDPHARLASMPLQAIDDEFKAGW